MPAFEDQVFTFGEFTLAPRERLFLRGQQPVPLTPKAFDLLVALVRRSGHLVTKDDLLREVWPGTFVEEVNLTVHISGLRKALDRGAKGASMIETVPTHGYRFVAPVMTQTRRLSCARSPRQVAESLAGNPRTTPTRIARIFMAAMIGTDDRRTASDVP